ncbi:MAG: hypothetical protein H0W72_11380 [Planctomycetes bacterium]|nr:hypothetical protein [Planctomycetota bacterium]
MVMRLEVEFARPLDRPTRLRLVVAFATLAKVDRVRFVQGDHVLIVIGEALGTAAVAAVLRDEGMSWQAMRTTLPEGEDRSVEEAVVEGERVVPLGRGRTAPATAQRDAGAPGAG